MKFFIASIGFLLRIGLLFYGKWQDENFQVKFTDIDYYVFSDASNYVYQGGSPYDRPTYRYTPFLSFLLLGNLTIHPTFGKWLFILSDAIAAWSIYYILKVRGISSHKALWWTTVWWWNPFVAIIATRGNAESIIASLVLLSYLCVLKRRLVCGGFLFALAVHFKIYPAIYGVPLLRLLEGTKKRTLVQSIFNKERFAFFIAAAVTFFGLFLLCYRWYGIEFFENTYLYHVYRKDHRHNFSIYFYFIYLTFQNPMATIMAIACFLPQLVIVCLLGWKYSKDCLFAFFLQTFAFVTYNKVITSQYFMWFLCFLPFVLSSMQMPKSKGLFLIFNWICSQGIWLSNAYQLEFLGKPTFIQLWGSSVYFFITNIVILTEIIKSHRS